MPPDVKLLPEDLPRATKAGVSRSSSSGGGTKKGVGRIKPRAGAQVFVPKVDMLTDRHNVFDGDEFDVSVCLNYPVCSATLFVCYAAGNGKRSQN